MKPGDYTQARGVVPIEPGRLSPEDAINGELDTTTGQIVMSEPDACAEMMRPHGTCATGCGHPATEAAWYWRASYRPCRDCGLVYLCHHCAIAERLNRARKAVKRIPELEAELAKAKEECGHAQQTR